MPLKKLQLHLLFIFLIFLSCQSEDQNATPIDSSVSTMQTDSTVIETDLASQKDSVVIPELTGTVADTASAEFQFLTEIRKQIDKDSLIEAEQNLQSI